MDQMAQSLISAQRKAEDLFVAVVDGGLIRPGMLESELSVQIDALARQRFGLRRHWHKRIVRSGPNTLLTYHDPAADRRLSDDEVVYLDFGPVFGAWEADFGRTYVLGNDPAKHRLVGDIAAAFQRGKQLFRDTPALPAGALYDFVAGLAESAGWQFGAPTAGHLIGQFPHERPPPNTRQFSIRHGNEVSLRAPDAAGRPRHWILEIHFVDRTRQIGGFLEELLTLDTGIH